MKKGFTMIEIIAVIIILALLMIVAIPAISALLQRFRRNYYRNLESSLRSSAYDYIIDNSQYKPRRGEYKIICITRLERENYSPRVNDYRGRECDRLTGRDNKSFVVIYRKKLEESTKEDFVFQACLYCEKDSYSTKNTVNPFCDIDKMKEENKIPKDLDLKEYCKYARKSENDGKGIIVAYD